MKIGVILGSGFEEFELLQNAKEIEVDTPFGKPSSNLITSKIYGIDVAIILRYGKKHEIPPSSVNDRANIFALKYEGCKHIISFGEVISLRDEMKKGDFAVLSQFVDFTKQRKLSFFEKFEFGAIHASMSNPFSEFLRKKIINVCKELGINFHRDSTIVTVEGSRFPTKAENKVFRQWGDLVDMSFSPEAILANEGEVDYASLGLVTASDTWENGDELEIGEIKRVISSNAEKIKTIFLKIIESFSEDKAKQEIKEMIRVIDFPRTGISFKDVSTLLKDADGLKKIIDILYKKYKEEKIDLVAGIGAGSFGIAGIMAERLNAGFVMMQNPKELVNEKIPENIESPEKSKLELYKELVSKGQKTLIIGEVLATGETALMACKFIEKLGGVVHECAFVAELPELNGRPRLEINNYNIFSIVEFKDKK